MSVTLLYCGDCLEVMPTLEENSIDLVLADLPYGTTACKWDTEIPLEPLWAAYKRLIKNGCPIVLFGSQPFTSRLVLSNPEWFRYEWIWEKERPTNVFMMKKQPGKVHENVLVFMDDYGCYHPQMTPSVNQDSKVGSYKSHRGLLNKGEYLHGEQCFRYSKDYNPLVRYPRSVVRFSRGLRKGKKLQRAQKPVPLLEYFIKTYTNEGDVVLDNVMGSGSTGVACVNLGRNFVGIEVDKVRFEIAKERIELILQEKKGMLI